MLTDICRFSTQSSCRSEEVEPFWALFEIFKTESIKQYNPMAGCCCWIVRMPILSSHLRGKAKPTFTLPTVSVPGGALLVPLVSSIRGSGDSQEQNSEDGYFLLFDGFSVPQLSGHNVTIQMIPGVHGHLRKFQLEFLVQGRKWDRTQLISVTQYE